MCLPLWQILHVCAGLHVLVFWSSPVYAILYMLMCQLHICVPTCMCQCASLHVCDTMHALMCLWCECISHPSFVTSVFISLWLPAALLPWLQPHFTVTLGCSLIIALNNQLIHCELCKVAIIISLAIAIGHKAFNILMKCQRFVSSTNFIVGKDQWKWGCFCRIVQTPLHLPTTQWRLSVLELQSYLLLMSVTFSQTEHTL